MSNASTPITEGGQIVVVYRAVGKLGYGYSQPTTTADFDMHSDAVEQGVHLCRAGVWAEFYVKTVYRVDE